MVSAVFVFVVLFVVLVLIAHTDKSLRGQEEIHSKEVHYPEEKCVTPKMFGIWLLMTGKNKYFRRKRLGL